MDTGSVRDFYKGKAVLVTGGTGFMGKVLIEKLLRCCPGIKTIYVMARSKRAMCPTVRIQNMAKLPLFEPLLKEQPDAFKKVVPIIGDLTKNGLGLRWELRDVVVKEVQIIFNLGASLRLESDLKDHVAANLEGTKKVLELAKEMPKLESLVHVSTVFCQCEPPVVEEKIFPPKISPHAVMDMADWLHNKEDHSSVTKPLLGEHPNCYTFTKQLAEALIDEWKNELPVSIVRPSIVTPTHHEPFPGWVDSLNGPIGILAAGGKGVMRSMMCGENNKAEMVPCDVAINCVLLAAWKRTTMRDVNEVPVYNVSSAETLFLTYGDVMNKGKEALAKYPLNPGLWYPGGTITTSKVWHETKVFFLQIIPALIIDFLLFIFGQKTFMMRVQEKIRNGVEVLKYFTMRTWNVKINNCLALHNGLSKEEKEIFFLANIELGVEELMKNAVIGTKVYCLREPIDSLPSARKKLLVYWIVDKLFRAFCIYKLAMFLVNMYVVFMEIDFDKFDLTALPLKSN